MSGSNEEYDLSQLNPDEYYNVTFYKERWEPIKMSTGEVLEQRLIVTFSFKYREYLSYVRNRQISRAQALIDSGRGNTSKRKSPNDAKRYIKSEYCTSDGELAQIENFSLNQDMIDHESRFDGFYGICTDLEGSAGFRTDYQIVTKKQMRSIIAQTKKRDKDNAERLIYYISRKNIEATNRHYSGL